MKAWEAIKLLHEGKFLVPPGLTRAKYIKLRGSKLLDDNGYMRSITDIPKDGWEIYEEPGHDFAWAKAQLRQGNCVKRKVWSGGHWRANDGFVEWISKEPGPIEDAVVVDLDDLDATDWILAE